MRTQMMTRSAYIRSFRWLLLVLLTALLCNYGCSSGTPIQKILNNPREYSRQPITVTGEVVEVFSLIVVKYFVLRDGTGEITVITERTMPKKGVKVNVTGMVKEAFSIGDKQLIVLVEQDHDNK